MALFKRIIKKYQDMPLPVKASIWFVICGVLKDAIDILATPIFARILTKEQYGLFNVYNSWFQIVKIIFTLYLFSDVFNVGLVKHEDDRARFVSSTLGFVTTSVGIYFVIYLIFRESVNRIVGLPWYLVVLLFVHTLVYVPYYCWIRRERYDSHYRNVVVVSVLYVFLQPVTAIIAIICMDLPIDPGYTRILMAVGVQIVIGSVLYISLMAQGKTFFHRGYWKYSLKTGIELVPYNLSKVVLNQSDRIMINFFSGSGDTGVYSIAHSAAFVLSVITESLNGAFVPWLYRRLKVKEYEGVRNVIKGLLLMVAVCVFGIDMIAPEIMRILGSKDYYQGVYCVPSLVYSAFLIFVYTLFTNIELFLQKNVYVTIASSIGMVVNIILNAIFIPKYGFIAAGFTTLVSYIVICVGHFIFLRNCLAAEEIHIGTLIDIKNLTVLSFVMLLFTLGCVALYKWTIIRWAIVFFLVIMLIVTKNRWITFIMTFKGEKQNG